jgi:methanol--5-hydroxybenzimidazolylcobamide Co-methyltransferase
MAKKFDNLELDKNSLMFGYAKYPVTQNGITIGGGKVIPEINFTLPPMIINDANKKEIVNQYKEMMQGICERSIALHQYELVVEFELLPQMTFEPYWGEIITTLLKEILAEYEVKHGLKYLLRITPTDIREVQSPPLRREGKELQNILESFRGCIKAGGDLLSIESIGGKEVTDKAIIEADIAGMIFGVGILAVADMEYLWGNICKIAEETHTIPAGDTACAIGNTAMVLAEKNYIPKVFAAVVRVLTVVRSLVAYEQGAVGPGKDCAYENPFLKSITGYPMSLEGKTAACAHLSSLGNITGAYADLWSNESIQNIKLLAGIGPVVSYEQLVYDCRLFNASIINCSNIELQNCLIQSDASLDPQAYILKPECVTQIAQVIVSVDDNYLRCLNSAKRTIELLKKGFVEKGLVLTERETKWLDILDKCVECLPTDKGQFVHQEKKKWSKYVNFNQYGLE